MVSERYSRYAAQLSCAALMSLVTVNATPGMLVARDDDLQILMPNASTEWVVGQQATVTWNVSDIPASMMDGTTSVTLGLVSNSSSAEGLMIENTLAQGFAVLAGSVSFTVPNVTPGNHYVALLGDPDNMSPQFTITNSTITPSSSSGVGSSSTSTTSPTSSLRTSSTTNTLPLSSSSASASSGTGSASISTTSTSSAPSASGTNDSPNSNAAARYAPGATAFAVAVLAVGAAL